MNNYKLLPALVSLLQTRNLTHTAKELNVTQSAMSKTLNQIRIAFGDQILLREGAHFILTKRGEELKSELPSLLLKLDTLYLPSLMVPLSCNRKFTLASSDYVAQAIFPSISKSIELQAPNASLEYLLWEKDQILELGGNSIDLVTTMVEVVPENIYGKLMAEDRLVVIFSSSHSFCSNSLSLNDYCKAKHITITGGGDKDLLVDIELSSLGRKRKIFANVPFFQSAIELLLTTNTVLTIPLHIAACFANRYDLQIRELPFALKEQHYYLLWHAKNNNDPQHKWFRELCYPFFKKHLELTIKEGMKLLHAEKSKY